MIIAIIDMGTNTFNLIIKKEGAANNLFLSKVPVQLGRGGFKEQQLAVDAMERALQCLRDFKSQAEKFRAKEIFAFATSAVRDASNQEDFVSTIARETGIKVNVIDGEQEARLIYYGVRQAVELGNDPELIMDIGGGSTEFIIGTRQQPLWLYSFDIGSARMMERFNPSNPMTEEEIQAVRQYLDDMLAPLYAAAEKYRPGRLVGSSGSFETLAAMIISAQNKVEVIEPQQQYSFNMKAYHAMADRMIAATLAERLSTPGMMEMRAPLMGLACIFINLILEKLKIKSIKLSTYALKEGVFYSLNENRQLWQRSLL